MSDLVFYGASDDRVEVEGACIVEGRHVKREEFQLPMPSEELLLLLVHEDKSMGVVVSYRDITNGIWAVAPVILREDEQLPWRVSISDGTDCERRPNGYSMVLTVHGVPEGVTVVGPEYDGG